MQTTNEKLDVLIEKINMLIPEPADDNCELQVLAKAIDELRAEVKADNDKRFDAINEKLLSLEGLLASMPTIDVRPLRNDIAELKTMHRLKATSDTADDAEAEATPAFTKRMYKAVMIAFVVTMAISVASYKWLLPAFPFALGLFVTMMGVGVWLFLDEFIFITNSIGKLAKNAVGIGLATLAISVLYFTGVTIGTSYFSNPYGGENESAVKVIKYDSGYSGSGATITDTSGTRSNSVKVLNVEDGGKAQSEQ